MHKSARTAHTIRPSRSGSSTMQPATGQAAWQIEHANAPKHRSGSITAIVFGAFLRGPDIILVHMAAIIAESPERMAVGGFADFRHREKERRGVLVDQVVGVGPEETGVAGARRVCRRAESLARFAHAQTVAGSGCAGVR